MFPIMLDLTDRPCLLVGAGPVAHRKLLSLLAEGARVTVVAPTAIAPIAELAAATTVRWHQRAFADADVDGFQLVLVATGQPAVDRQVVAAARRRGAWVNVADVPALCDFHLPSRVRRGDLQVAIASAGSAPFAVRRLRQLLEANLGPEWAEWAAAAKRFRQRVQAQALSPDSADAAYDRFVSSTVAVGACAARVPSAAEETAWMTAAAGGPAPPGRVALVGSGPGAPGLITVRGLQLLREAEAIVYDRLSIPAIPLDLPDRIELVGVGKEAGHHPVPQDEINRILLRLASAGKRVVRLKGGDPFVFARGGEEAEVLAAHGIPYEVVPGVTAGIAGPAAAGIPVTFRREAVRLTFVTAHEGGSPHLRWDLLAQDQHATLVGYMGSSSLAQVRDALLAAGMSGQTPATVIEQATLPGQRWLRSPLADLPEAAARAGIKSPAVFVIGQVVAHAGTGAAPRPLHGMRVGLFAPAGAVATALETAGAVILAAPLPPRAAARLVLGAAPLSAWLVGHSAELDALEVERRVVGFPSAAGAMADMQIWCTDATVAAEARARGWPRVTVLGAEADPATIVRQIGQPSMARSAGGPTSKTSD